MAVLFCITGDRGAGKSELAHQLATKVYPEALVLDEHPPGTRPGDADLRGRIFWTERMTADSIRGWRGRDIILVGDPPRGLIAGLQGRCGPFSLRVDSVLYAQAGAPL